VTFKSRQQFLDRVEILGRRLLVASACMTSDLTEPPYARWMKSRNSWRCVRSCEYCGR